MQILGANRLPSFFSAEDVESLNGCICGSTALERIYEEFGLGIERCLNCGTVRSNPRLKQSAIQRCYEAGAQNRDIYNKMYGKTPAPPISWRSVENRYRAIAQKLISQFPEGSAPSLLEIGFGRGEFLPHLCNAGFHVHGFDISETACQKLRAKGIPATCAPSLESAHLPSNSLDVVAMWEVFEHIPEPAFFAAEVQRILKPGGYWFLQVPNWRWLNFKTRVISALPGKKDYISKYGLIGPVFHLYHYTHESLKRLLTGAGFQHAKSMRIHLYDETNWKALVAHEGFYWLDSVPALMTRNHIHWDVVLCELYRKVLVH